MSEGGSLVAAFLFVIIGLLLLWRCIGPPPEKPKPHEPQEPTTGLDIVNVGIGMLAAAGVIGVLLAMIVGLP